MNRILTFLALTLVLALAVGLPLGLVGCTKILSTTPPTEKLQILSHSMSIDEHGHPVVQGTAKNVSSTTLDMAFIEVKWYDASGAVIANGTDHISNLGPGEIWKFEIPCFEENVQSYEVGVRSVR